MLTEERLELVERDQAHSIVEIDVPSTGYADDLFGLGGTLVRVLAELVRVSLIARDEEHRARRDRFDVIERVEVHEFDVAGQRWMRRQLGRTACRRELAAGRAIEIVELTLDGSGVGRQPMHCAAGVLRLAARELDVAL